MEKKEGMKSMARPNILFAFADDWGRYASAYQQVEGFNTPNALLNTPNFDRVAKEGVLFTNAFAPAPSCTPCRSSLLSGRYFWQCGLGAILHGAVWDESIPSYPLMLEESGYHIGHTYKVWSPGRTADAPYGAERTQYMRAGEAFRHFSQNATKWKKDLGVEGAKQKLLDETRENFDAFLRDRPEGQPFCYWWGPMNTHRGWIRGSGKDLWGLNPDDLKGRLPDFLPDVHEVRQDFCDYLGECQAVDAGLGVLLDRLEEIGELDNTLVVVSGDHGIPGIPRGKSNLYDIGNAVALAARWPGNIPAERIVEDFVNLMDLTPTFLEAGGVNPPPSIPAKSLMPVLTSRESGQIDSERSFVVTGRERHVAIARDGNLPYPHRAIRTARYLYIRNFRPDRWPAGESLGLDDPAAEAPPYEELEMKNEVYKDVDPSPTKAWMIHHRAEEGVKELFELGFAKRPQEELYDLEKDPCYMQNLVEKEAYQDIRRKLNNDLMQVLRENDDPRVCEDPCRFEHPPFTNDTI